MRASATTDAPAASGADTIAVAVFDGEQIAHDTAGGELQALLDSGEAKTRYKSIAHTHADGKRWIVAGLGDRKDFDLERARVAAALVAKRAGELTARSLCWELPHDVADATAGALVEGTELAAFRFERYHTSADEDERPPELEELTVSAHHDVAASVQDAVIVAEAVKAARVLQNTPANDMTPTALANRARELADEIEGLDVEVEGRDGIEAKGMGAFAAVAQGSYQEPALITLRYSGPSAGSPKLGFVGKAVTFDSGGISIKPSAKMNEMKFDMSGGAAVLEATGAIARLGLPVNLVSVIGATENMPSGRSVKPGDIVRTMAGKTVEVNNTDAEGRLVLSDCLAWAKEQGAERLIDLATLTGAIIISLGSTYAGLMSNDDAWAASVTAAADATGELVWRMPLHPEYAEMVKGQYGDLDNAPEGRKAGSITAAEFLRNFAGDTPWVHLDIAGVSWDLGRPYAPKAGSGFGVRLLVELAREHGSS